MQTLGVAQQLGGRGRLDCGLTGRRKGAVDAAPHKHQPEQHPGVAGKREGEGGQRAPQIGGKQHTAQGRTVDQHRQQGPDNDIGQAQGQGKHGQHDGPLPPAINQQRHYGGIVQPVGEIGGHASQRQAPRHFQAQQRPVTGSRRFLRHTQYFALEFPRAANKPLGA